MVDQESLTPLQTLFAQCQQNLHNNGLLTLGQLAPIHQTMFQCAASIFLNISIDVSSLPELPNSIEPILEATCSNPADKEIVRRHLVGSVDSKDKNTSTRVSDAHKLFWLQFLMHRLGLEDSLRFILIPYFVSNPVMSSDEEEESSDLESALLDWVGQQGQRFDQTHISASAILQSLVQTPATNPSASRILVKLVEMDSKFSEASTATPSSLIPALYEIVWKTLQAAMKSPPMLSSQTTFQTHPILNSISKHLIPPLIGKAKCGDGAEVTTEAHRSHLHTLWQRLRQLWGESSSQNDFEAKRESQRLALLVITTALCPLLPHLVAESLPLSSESSAIPLEQPILWEWIFEGLSQGKSPLEDGIALSSILRRRSLFLLNTVAITNEWKQYVMCFETLEMENEQHLVDQIWESVGEICESLDTTSPIPNGHSFCHLTFDWMSLLFGCVLSSNTPAIRKMGMYRVLKAQNHEWTASQAKLVQKQSKKAAKKDEAINAATTHILERMPPDFVLKVLIPSWNSLGKTVGYTMHVELRNGKLHREDMIPLMRKAIKSYVIKLDSARSGAFWKGLFDWSLTKHLTTKTMVLLLGSLAETLQTHKPSLDVPLSDVVVQSMIEMVLSFFSIHSVVITHRREILEFLSIALAHAVLPVESTRKQRYSPLTILRAFCLFKPEYFKLSDEAWDLKNEPILNNLKAWVTGIGQNNQGTVATLATAFVDGQLNVVGERSWDPEHGATPLELEQAWGISVLASLSVGPTGGTTGEILWPAISKGILKTAGAVMTCQHPKADHVSRAILLLENGCLLRQLSGLGNGDIVVDQKTLQALPPPPYIEGILSSSIDFILFHVRALLSIEENEATNGAMQTSKTYALLVSQLRTLHQSFPSSNVLSSGVELLLKSSSEALQDKKQTDGQRVMHSTLIYAALSSGANPGKENYVSLCKSLIAVELSGDTKHISNTWQHMARSVLFYAKWASVSRVLPMLGTAIEKESGSSLEGATAFAKWVLEQSFDAIQGAAYDAVVPVFNAVLESARIFVRLDSVKEEESYVDIWERIVGSLLDLIQEATLSYEGVYMLNETCSLLFQAKFLREEYDRFAENEHCRTPIREGFRSLIKNAGNYRAHINHTVLCQITIGWMGEDMAEPESIGLSAIPYRDDIIELLLHKEVKKDECATNQSREEVSGGLPLPPDVNQLSLTRSFLLVFLSRLPHPSKGLNPLVQKELIEPVILGLLSKAKPVKSKKHSLVMKGTPTYCLKMRAWQALCILSHFVSARIAKQVCECTFKCIEETIHSQVRYFVEIFAIKCAALNQEVFCEKFMDEILRTDLTLQQIASLMILGGNWIVGRYKLDFFFPDKNSNNIRLRRVVAGVIPWLSSTQGFSRAIAQLLVYAVIPLVVDVEKKGATDPISGGSDWLYRLIFNFLDQNKEMIRLRKKQLQFFETYEIESICTPEGVLGIPVDEGDEADPAHLVDVMKQTLIDVYDEAHGSDAPVWKQMAEIMQKETEKQIPGGGEARNGNDLVNFQRKIIPLDALNLAMESQREIKLKNAVGQKKQQLIVCAALIDKIPNLGGLARTAEIFAADRLIIPDKSVCKMDNFKSVSVGAGEWIDIEQVRPEGLLEWLLRHKAQGYFIFGLEQTASSVALDKMEFPDRPTILLLGKEKEGIPVEYLQAVDQCVEIPQLGIIRSLNVHVSGAIAIWEHTKQRRLNQKK